MIPKPESFDHHGFFFILTVSKSIMILISLPLLSVPSSNHCNATQLVLHNITRSQSLSHPNTLVSPGETFELGFFTPSNNRSSRRYVGVWYRGVYPRTLIWVANRETPLNLSDFKASLAIAPNGNLEIFDGNNQSVWSSKSPARSTTVATLLENGNLVVTDSMTGVRRWQSFDQPGDAFLPGSKLGFDLRSGVNFSLRSWRSEYDPSPGGFTVEILRKRPPEVVIRSTENRELRWRSGPWDKTKYTGVPEMETYSECQYGFVDDVEKGTSYMTFTAASIIRCFYVSPQEIIRLMEKSATDDKFRLNWETPNNPCDLYGACGMYGVCKNYTNSMCECLKGFETRSGRDWRAGNWTGGCVRKSELACDRRNGTTLLEADGFLVIRDVKPPDFYEFVELGYPSADHCKRVCLRNCSCLAYAHVKGIGCLVWSHGLIDLQGFSYGGEKIFYRVSRKELDGQRRLEIILSIVAVFVALGMLGTTMLILHNRRVRQKDKTTKLFETGESMSQGLQLLKQNNPTELPLFDFGAILVATNHFSPTNKLGQGGFGTVYKGIMPDGKRMAVKRLASSSGQGTVEFENEMVLISRLQHRNLVRLFGYCIKNEEKLLVYEYMPNNSLDHFIFDSERRAKLGWGTRMNIILGVSRGLAYLHHDSCLRVVHRDLKVSNILLDEKMNPKISDFGLARMFQGTMDLANTQRVVGTLGYMSPEYAIAGIFSEKSDVFSFGVLLLEILSGTKNTSFYDYEDQLTLIPYAWKLWSEDKGQDMVDKALDGLFSEGEVKRSLHVALLCVQDNAVDRPTMTHVVFMLSNETYRPSPKHPLFSFRISKGCGNRKPGDSNNNNSTSSNELTTSLVEGR